VKLVGRDRDGRASMRHEQWLRPYFATGMMR
jgi:hypothetical protein